jgi:hypothetical protein
MKMCKRKVLKWTTQVNIKTLNSQQHVKWRSLKFIWYNEYGKKNTAVNQKISCK